MNDEIKEILEYLKKSTNSKDFCGMMITKNNLDKILDYITNLQEENERLSVELNQNMIERNNYLSRCEKAIEHIKEHQLIYTSQYEEESNFDNHLLDILNGGDE